MKKIGILTFSMANNYGALLQAYALKTALDTLRARADIINYLCPALERWHSPDIFIKRSLKGTIKSIILFPYFLFIRCLFYPFMKKYLNGGTTYKKEQLVSLNGIYDAFITGSDQVFNQNLTNGDTTYYLDFIRDNSKKFSYAASFGYLPKPKELFRADLLKKFKHLSLREQQAANVLKDAGFTNITTDIDPVLLLKKEAWADIADTKGINGDFIFFYSANDDDKIISFAKRLSKDTGLKIVYSSGSFLSFPLKAKYPFATVQQWLGYMLKAKYVVTNSFHGLAFSINLNKNFFIDFLPKEHKGNSRLESLLDIMGLQNRLIANTGNNYNNDIDWQSVNKILDIERAKSLNYLKSILDGSYEQN